MNNASLVYRATYQTIGIICISTVLALIVNMMRPDSIPLIGNWSIQSQLTLSSGENIGISVHEARQLYLDGKAVILDARSPEEYRAGHIDCAINLPWLFFEEHFQKVSELPDDLTIITYCDGEACSLSKDLAMALIDFGFKHVRVIVNGWTVWVQNNYPVATGDQRCNR